MNKEELAREYMLQRLDGYHHDAIIDAFIAGFNAATAQASDSFETWFKNSPDIERKDAWIAARLSAQKEIEDLKKCYSGTCLERNILRDQLNELKAKCKRYREALIMVESHAVKNRNRELELIAYNALKEKE
jgi:hypothetical protein